MKKKLIVTIIICLMISLLIGTSAFAEEPGVTEILNVESSEEQMPEADFEEISDVDKEAAPEENTGSSVEDSADTEKPAAAGEDAPEKDEITVLSEKETEEEPSEESVQQESAEEITEEDEEIPNEQPAVEEITSAPAAEPIAEEPDTTVLPYVVTVSNGNRSVDLTGGTVNTISYILSELGYDVADAEIAVDPESVDTEVISVDESEDGLALSDKGPFSKADRKLVVYINGEMVELTVVDPTEIGGDAETTDYSYETISKLFSSGDRNVRLIGNVRVTGDGSIQIGSVTHDLYLNGYTLNLGTSSFNIGSGATLNIYGGYDCSISGQGSITGNGNECLVANGGTVNIYSGTVSVNGESNTQDTAVLVEGNGLAQIFGGTIIGERAVAFNNTSNITTCDTDNNSIYTSVRILGGLIKGDIYSSVLHTIDVAGGTFSVDPRTKFSLLGGDSKWNVSMVESQSETLYKVLPKDDVNSYACVIFADNNTKTQGMTSLMGALSSIGDCDRIFLLKDQNITHNIAIDGKNITIDLNGKVIRADFVTSDSAFTVNASSKLTVIDSSPSEQHTGLPLGGVITGGTGTTINDKDYGGAVLVKSKGHFIMNGGTITGNSSDYFGGGVSVEKNGTFTMNGGAITGNSSKKYGGGVYVEEGGSFTMNGGIIDNNTAGEYGGGVLSNKGEITIGGAAQIISNTGYGGRRNLSIIAGKPITVKDDFSGKIGATILPGLNGTPQTGIFTTENLSEYISLDKFFSDSDNYGVVYTSGKAIALSKGIVASVTTNVGTRDFDSLQAAIDADGSGTAYEHAVVSIKLLVDTIESVTIGEYQEITLDMNGKVLNTVNYITRAIENNGKLILKDSATNSAHIQNDLPAGAVINGGGIYNSTTGYIEIYDCTITNSSIMDNGGGIRNAGTVKIYNGRIVSNYSSTGDGGGVYNHEDGYSPVFEMYGGEISGNRSRYNGGGVFNKGIFNIKDVSIANNTAGYSGDETDISEETGGGGVYNNGNFSMINSYITGNRAYNGGGIYNDYVRGIYSQVQMYGGFIMGNRARIYGLGVYNEADFVLIDGVITQNILDSYECNSYDDRWNTWNKAGFYFRNLDLISDVTLGGTARIEGNDFANLLIKDSWFGANIWVSEDRPLEEGASIYVLTEYSGIPLPGHVTQAYSGTVDYIGYFHSDYRNLRIAIGPFVCIHTYWEVIGTENVHTYSANGSSLRITETVSMDYLPETHQSAVNKMLETKGMTLVALVDTGKDIGSYGVTITIVAKIFEGYNAEELTAWLVNDDSTLTQVTFVIVDGNIVINDGKPGVYVLTVSA